MVQISKELAQNLIDDIQQLANENLRWIMIKKYELRQKYYENEIKHLKKAIEADSCSRCGRQKKCDNKMSCIEFLPLGD